jgi:1-acyl-sn-glycerol-3-phosphate acyltransferase
MITNVAMSRGSYRPFLVGVGATLRASAEVLVRSAVGRLDEDKAERIIQRWTRSIMKAGDTTVIVEGREHIPAAGAGFVLMSNHRSHVDIPSIIHATQRPMRMVGKQELARVPVWGPAMRKLGMVFVTRGDKQKAIRELEDAKARFREGTSIWIAPEGTRSRDGQLGAFKKGGFHLARDLGAPILPAYITGTDEIMKPESFRIHKHKTVRVRFAPVIPTAGASVEELMERVRAAMMAMQGSAPGGSPGA